MVVDLKNRDGMLGLSKCFPANIAIPQEITTRGLNEFVTKSTQRVKKGQNCERVASRKRHRCKRICVYRGL